MENTQTADGRMSVKDYVYNVSAAVSNAILVMLGVGLLFQSVANIVHWNQLYQIGAIAQVLLPAGFGAAVASQMKVNTLVMFSSMISATVGANGVYFTSAAVNGTTATGWQMHEAASSMLFTTGQPISAVLAAIVAVMVGKYLSGKTPLDMMLVPLASTAVGTLFGLGAGAVTTPALNALSKWVSSAMTVSPLIGSMLLALAFAIFLMTPASSAALAIAIALDPISSGATLIGTTAQFVGFLVMSFQENNIGANIAQGFITPKVQFPNLLKNPRLCLPSFVAAMVSAAVGTMFFHFSVPYTIGGLGLTSLIAPINLASTNLNSLWVYLFCGVLLPAVISVTGYRLMRAFHWAEKDDLHLEIV
ncbi:hypothetical protein C5L31_000528 [Secundilactobacillus malefermentans]|uniref:Phosphotransferase system EIIC domain-containing protein n=1 Tax=Secundilactobacillus malefermentans TaxID=176292 RepID=A0A4R5NQ99_9LACO|nr:PTS sugar transporter subunit IIC [Secundilactobacillus malefermentans]KRM57694.1 toxin regulator [Secundilactobacillus malefermentans DSM 5705 = KCTC 3548]TDG78868.1 hypothetical protein C5L31_000528 [Secundilactobacillus malefermentans]